MLKLLGFVENALELGTLVDATSSLEIDELLIELLLSGHLLRLRLVRVLSLLLVGGLGSLGVTSGARGQLALGLFGSCLLLVTLVAKETGGCHVLFGEISLEKLEQLEQQITHELVRLLARAASNVRLVEDGVEGVQVVDVDRHRRCHLSEPFGHLRRRPRATRQPSICATTLTIYTACSYISTTRLTLGTTSRA